MPQNSCPWWQMNARQGKNLKFTMVNSGKCRTDAHNIAPGGERLCWGRIITVERQANDVIEEEAEDGCVRYGSSHAARTWHDDSRVELFVQIILELGVLVVVQAARKRLREKGRFDKLERARRLRH